MASKIDICNMALSRLGLQPIQSLSDDTTEARSLNIIYNQVAENVMSMGPWTSCLVRVDLAQVSGTPTYGFNYIYQLPVSPKCLRVLELNEDQLGQIVYRIEGDKLLTDQTSVQILYIGALTNTESYDAYLRQAITERLIVELSYAKTGVDKNLQIMEQLFASKIEQWLNLNNIQGYSIIVPSSTFIDVR